MIDIGNRIRSRRKSLGLTGVEVAKIVGIGQSTLSQIENGTSPTLDTLVKICKALDIPPYELLKEENDINISTDLIQLIDVAKQLTEVERKNLTVFLKSTLERNS